MQFRYVVWNYTSEKARPIVYGVGHFVRTDLGSGRTRVRWTYSFQLNRRPLSGLSGANRGISCFASVSLTENMQMMRGSLAGSKAKIEGNTPVVASGVTK